MKLKKLNAAGLILKFDHECSRLYSILREKYLFIREDDITVTTGKTSIHINTELLRTGAEELDGDSFTFESVFNFENVKIYLFYGGENLELNLLGIIEKEDKVFFTGFEDIFNFYKIDELRKVHFPGIYEDTEIEQVMRRYEDFLTLYLKLIFELEKDEQSLLIYESFLDKPQIKLLDALKISSANTAFERGDYRKAAEKYGKTAFGLTHIQEVKFRLGKRAAKDKVLRKRLLEEFRLERQLNHINKVKDSVVSDLIWMICSFALCPLLTAIFFLAFYGIYYCYFSLIEHTTPGLVYLLKPHPGYCTVPAIFTGLLACFYPAYKLMERIRKNKIRSYIAMKKSTDLRLTRVSGVGLTVLIALLTVLVMFGLKWDIRFTGSAIYDGSKFFSFEENKYRYNEVEGIYFIENPKTLNPYYIIKYKNSSIANLINFSDYNTEIKNKLIPVLRSKGIKVGKGPEQYP